MKKRDNSIDIAKGIGIVLMIIGHSGCPIELKSIIYTFHMPLFFIIAGYLYNQDKWEGLGFKRLVITRAKAYLLPYFALSGINLGLNGIYELEKYKFPYEWMNSQLEHIGWIIYGASESAKTPNSSPLWFLPCILVAYVYFYCLMKIKRKDIRLLCCCVMTILMVCISSHVNELINVKYFPWHFEIALVGAVLMYIGHLINKRSDIKNISGLKALVLLVIIAIGMIFVNFGRVMMDTGQIGEIFSFYVSNAIIFVLILKIAKKISELSIGRVFEFFGNQSIIALGFNYWLNRISKRLWHNIPLLREVEYTWWVKTIVGLIGVWGISVLWKRIRKCFGNKVIGVSL